MTTDIDRRSLLKLGAGASALAALGVPTQVLIASGIGKFWYWGFDGETTVWYPSVRLIRQPAGEGWENSLKIMHDRVKAFAA